jgi:hypothetical protein
MDDTARLGGEDDLLANVAWKLNLFEHSNVQWRAVIDLGQRPHHLDDGGEVLSRDAERCGRKDERNPYYCAQWSQCLGKVDAAAVKSSSSAVVNA